MKTDELIAIDTHTHLEVSCWNPFDSYGEEFDRAADKYFRSSKRPTMAESLAYYREKKIGFVMFTVDAETQLGRRRIPNEEIAEAAQANSDIIIAHPSWPWQDEAISLAMHKPNVWIDLSGWSPKYFPPQLVQYANTLLKDKVMFGSDYPLITPDRWLADFEALPIKPEVRPKILKWNAARLLGLSEG